MRTSLPCLALAIAVTGYPLHAETPPNQLSPEEVKQGFKLLWDGRTFDGWEQKGNWGIEDGSLARQKSGSSLVYTVSKVPDDFELRFEWKVSRGCNSGVYYRPTQYEYQVLDNIDSPYGENPRQAAASLFFCMAPSKDATRAVGEWNARPVGLDVRRGGSLDLGVRAASSIAAAYLRHGDRVGLIDLGHPRGGVPVGSGHRQLQRIRHQLVHAARRVEGSGDPVLNHAQVPPGATVVVLSPFLDDQLVDLTVRLTRRGRFVLAVDLMPAELAPDRTTPWGAPVASIVRAEHRMRLRALEEHGVVVVPWDGGGQVAAVLRRVRGRRR